MNLEILCKSIFSLLVFALGVRFFNSLNKYYKKNKWYKIEEWDESKFEENKYFLFVLPKKETEDVTDCACDVSISFMNIYKYSFSHFIIIRKPKIAQHCAN